MKCTTTPDESLPCVYVLLCAFKGVIKYDYDQVC